MKASKKLISSIVVLALTIVFAGATTFAWFSMNTTVDVGNIDSTVTTGNAGLFMSLDENGTYTPSISFAATADPANGVYLTSKIMGTGFAMDAVTLKSNKMVLEDGKTVAKTGSVENGQYVSYTIYFRADTPMTIKLANAADKTYVKVKDPSTRTLVKAWESIEPAVYGNAATIAVGADLVTRAAYAARVSFTNTTTPNTTVVWDPHSANAASFKDTATRNIAQDYNFRLKNPGATLPTQMLKEEVFATKKDNTSIYNENLVTLALVGGFYTGSIRVDIWLEGCDNDCFNSILKDAMSIGLQFTAAA